MPVRLNSSGGGSVTLDVPATAGTFTATVPANTGTLVTTGSTAAVTQGMLASGVAGNGPAFSAYNSNFQGISASTDTKVTFNTEEYDTANCFASSRFTPNVTGYYLLNAQVRFDNGTFSGEMFISIYKNGNLYRRLNNVGAAAGQQVNGSAPIYLNGTTDYVELYALSGGSGTINIGYNVVPFCNYFSAFLLRAA